MLKSKDALFDELCNMYREMLNYAERTGRQTRYDQERLDRIVADYHARREATPKKKTVVLDDKPLDLEIELVESEDEPNEGHPGNPHEYGDS